MIMAAARQLRDCVATAIGNDWPVRVRFESLDVTAIPAGTVLILSLADDMADSAAVRWRIRIARCAAAGHRRILLCNLFRHVVGGGQRTDVIERIRRLDRMAIDLSREAGAEIVDIDRLFALCGARALGSAAQAAQLAGHAIAAAILEGGLDEHLDPAVQDRATHLHGGVRDIRAIAERRLQGIAPS